MLLTVVMCLSWWCERRNLKVKFIFSNRKVLANDKGLNCGRSGAAAMINEALIISTSPLLSLIIMRIIILLQPFLQFHFHSAISFHCSGEHHQPPHKLNEDEDVPLVFPYIMFSWSFPIYATLDAQFFNGLSDQLADDYVEIGWRLRMRRRLKSLQNKFLLLEQV